MKRTPYYTLAWNDGTPVEIRRTGYADLLAASNDAQLWVAATGRPVRVVASDARPTGIVWEIAA